MLRDHELREFAEELILSHAHDIETMAIYDLGEDVYGRELTGAEYDQVRDWLSRAVVTVTFQDPS